jgi:hypothetical protein
MKKLSILYSLLAMALMVIPGFAQEAQVDRTELPIKGPWYPPITTLDARDAKAFLRSKGAEGRAERRDRSAR